VLVGSMLAAGSPGLSQQSSDRRVDAMFSDLSKPGSPGCAVGVYRDGKIVVAKGYGYANLEDSIPITPQTVFDVGSVAKQFTAASILLLEKQGAPQSSHAIGSKRRRTPRPRNRWYSGSGRRGNLVLVSACSFPHKRRGITERGFALCCSQILRKLGLRRFIFGGYCVPVGVSNSSQSSSSSEGSEAIETAGGTTELLIPVPPPGRRANRQLKGRDSQPEI